MKIRKVIDICKRSGNVLLFEGEKEQWISDGHAIYSMFNLPQFDEDSLCKTYDITDKQKKKIIFRHEMDLPSSYDFSDVIRDESMVQSGSMYIVDGGRSLIPYTASQGVVFVDAKYLQPFADEGTDLLQLYERQTEDGLCLGRNYNAC